MGLVIQYIYLGRTVVESNEMEPFVKAVKLLEIIGLEDLSVNEVLTENEVVIETNV